MKTQILQEQQGQTSMQSIADLMQEISAAIREKGAGAGQTKKAAQQLNTILQPRTQIFEETAVTVENLIHQAEERQQIMVFFKIGEATAGEMRVDLIQQPVPEKFPVVPETKNAQQHNSGGSKTEPSAPKEQCYVSGDVLTIGARAAIQEDYWEEDVEWF